MGILLFEYFAKEYIKQNLSALKIHNFIARWNNPSYVVKKSQSHSVCSSGSTMIS